MFDACLEALNASMKGNESVQRIGRVPLMHCHGYPGILGGPNSLAHTYIHTHIYIIIYIHTHIYIFTHTHTTRDKFGWKD